MGKFLSFSIVIVSCFLAKQSWAGFNLEPYAGYNIGTYKMELKEEVTLLQEVKGKVSGPGFGVRLYYEFLIPFFGLDVAYGSIKSDPDNSTGSTGTAMTVYGIAGVNIPVVGIGLYGGYAFSDSWSFTQDGEKYKYSGNAMKVGATLRVFPFLRINAEYITHNIDRLDKNGTEFTLKDYFKKVESNVLMIGIALNF